MPVVIKYKRCKLRADKRDRINKAKLAMSVSRHFLNLIIGVVPETDNFVQHV